MDLSYGGSGRAVEGLLRAFIVAAAGAMMAMSGPASAQTASVQSAVKDVKPIKLAVLGDSLTAGYGLPASAAFPVRLQKALGEKGIATDIHNAGVSGDTTTGGLARLDWSIPPGTEAVIVELGANDALRGVDPKVARGALDDILTKLKARNIAVLLCGMYAPPNYGTEYTAQFNSIYPELARSHKVPLYPFFLDGVATEAKLTQPDGLHPTAAGVDVVVERILPTVEAFLRDRASQLGKP
ncbi:MAG: arylesterase [Afipia sp.]|nr:arylesterase [Afipia sp.]